MNEFTQWKDDVRSALARYIRTHPTSISQLATRLKIDKHTLLDFVNGRRNSRLWIVSMVEQYLIKEGFIKDGNRY